MLRTIRSKYNSAGTIMRLPVFEEDEDPVEDDEDEEED